jgi:hypothetical protein
MGNPDLPRNQRGNDEAHYYAINNWDNVNLANRWGGPVIPAMADLQDGAGTQLCGTYCQNLGYNFMGLQWSDECW